MGLCTLPASAMTSSWAPATPAPQNRVTGAGLVDGVGQRLHLLGRRARAATAGPGRVARAGRVDGLLGGDVAGDDQHGHAVLGRWRLAMAVRSMRGICSGLLTSSQ